MIHSTQIQELPWCNIRIRSMLQIWVQCALQSIGPFITAKVKVDSESNQALWCQGCRKIVACSRSLRLVSAGLSCRCRGNSRKIAKPPPTWDLYPRVIKDRKTWTVRTRQKIRISIFSMRKMTISKLQQFKTSHQHRQVQLKPQEKWGLTNAYLKKSRNCLYITIRTSIGADRCPKGELPIFWQTRSTKKIKRDSLASRWSKDLHWMTAQPLSINSHQKYYQLLVSGLNMRSRSAIPPQTRMTNQKKKRKRSQWIKFLQSSPK